ncbi:MAG: hypothetical protein AAF206_11220 [Bacteroidota bacterium]
MKNFLFFSLILFSLNLFSQNATLEFGDAYKGGRLVNGSQQRLIKTSDGGGILYLYTGTAVELRRIDPQLNLVAQNKVALIAKGGVTNFVDLVSVDGSIFLFISVWNKKQRRFSLKRQEIDVNSLRLVDEGAILFTVPARNYREQGRFQVALSPDGKKLLAHGFNKPADLDTQQEFVQVYQGAKLEWEKRSTEHPSKLDRQIHLTNRGEVILSKVSVKYNYALPRSTIDCTILCDNGQTEREVRLKKEDFLVAAPTFQITPEKELICSGLLTNTEREAHAFFLSRYDLVYEKFVQQKLYDFDQLAETGKWKRPIIGNSAPLVKHILPQEDGGVILIAPFQQYVRRTTTTEEFSSVRSREISSSTSMSFFYGDICLLRIDKNGQLDWFDMLTVTPAMHDHAIEEPYYFARFPEKFVFIWGTQAPREWPRPRRKGGEIMMTTINLKGEQQHQRLYSQTGDNGILLHLTTGMEQFENELLFQVYKWEGPYMVRVTIDE